MNINVQSNYIAFTAENQEDSAKLAGAALLMRQNGYDTVYLLAYKTLEIPLCGLTKRAPDARKSALKKVSSNKKGSAKPARG